MRSLRVKQTLFLLIGAVFLLAGCNSEPTPRPTLIPTAPLPTRNAATVVVSTKSASCIDSFYYIPEDDYFTDDTVIEPGASFVQEWEVTNNGSCNWEPGYKLRFVSGEQMGAPEAIDIPSVGVGKRGKLTVNFTAPTEPGTYRSTWKAFNKDNRSFGQTVYVEIVVRGDGLTPVP